MNLSHGYWGYVVFSLHVCPRAWLGAGIFVCAFSQSPNPARGEARFLLFVAEPLPGVSQCTSSSLPCAVSLHS